MAVRKSEIAEFLGTQATGEDTWVGRVSGFVDAHSDSVVFAADDAALTQALASDAAVILAKTGDDPRVLAVNDPRTAFARVYANWFDTRGGWRVHKTALVEPEAVLGEGCEVGAFAQISAGVRLGEGCVIGPRVTILPGTTLGARVRVQAGAVLGSDGFGYVKTRDGYIGFPQIGTLWIGDDVEIGANTTIDRGALGETRIGRGTKIDNLVHIAHNCTIGEDVIIAAQVGMAGSCTIGDGAMLGGQVGLGEKVTIGPGVMLGGQGGLLPGKTLLGPGEVFWGTPARPVREYLRDLARMRKKADF
jgi:UDP-3-O-[3-hydroxymyristoyl] glucosamine N-acyltransferase